MIESGVALSTAFYTSVGGMSFGFSFLVVRWLAGFVAGRIDKKEDRLDTGLQSLLDDFRQEIDRMKAECVSLREGLAECERKHAESEEEVARLRGLMQGYGDAKQLAQLNVAADKARKKTGEGE